MHIILPSSVYHSTPRAQKVPTHVSSTCRYTLHRVRVTVINHRRHGRRRVRARLAAKVRRFTRSRPTGDDRAAVTHCCALRCCSLFTRVRPFSFSIFFPPISCLVFFFANFSLSVIRNIYYFHVQHWHLSSNQRYLLHVFPLEFFFSIIIATLFLLYDYYDCNISH